MAKVLLELYLRRRERKEVPQHILLDFDSTVDPTHGEQEGSYYHGYSGQHIYHPLLVFGSETGQLVTALLRCGNTHSSRGAVAILGRIVSRLGARWPKVKAEIRVDAGFAVPTLYEYCEKEGIDYTIGLISNARLEALAASLLEEANERCEAEGRKARILSEGYYRAESWEKKRRVSRRRR